MVQELIKFLSDKRRNENGPMTHTVYDGNSSLKGSYNINNFDISKLLIL